ncbi:MAG TPA: AI-2E family transporter [Verrucomicrobiae bacterium]|nr:AI-2E family transporter [Verrucomicrobiae bacterium]
MNFLPPTPKQARLIWLAVSGLAVATLVGLAVGLIWGLGRVLQILSPVLWPLAAGGIIAYLLDPVVDHFEKKGLSRAKAITAVFAIALLIVGILFGSIIPQLVIETRQLAGRIPDYTARIEQQAQKWVDNPPPLVRKLFKLETVPADRENSGAVTNDSANITSTNLTETTTATTNAPPTKTGAFDNGTLQSATDLLTGALPTVGRWIFGQVGRVAAWFGVLVGLALVPVYAFYLLLEKRGIESKWTNYLPLADSTFKDELVFVLRSINDYLIAFFRGQVLVAISDGILYTIGFLIAGLQYAILLGAAAVALTMIPFLGAIVLCFAALIISVVQYGDWMHPLYVLIVFAVVQTLEGLVISPKIMGDRVGLHPLTIILAVMFGTALLGGLLGGILAIPLTAVLRVLMTRYVWKKR